QTARQVMEVNFFAPYVSMTTVLPGMRQRRHGVIANMSSDDARAPGPGAGDYCASKAALSAATESLAYEARADGVRLHVIYPGWVPTEMGLRAVNSGGAGNAAEGCTAYGGAGVFSRAAKAWWAKGRDQR